MIAALGTCALAWASIAVLAVPVILIVTALGPIGIAAVWLAVSILATLSVWSETR
jgi:hypothetical protein